MSIYRYSKVICIVQILLLLKSNSYLKVLLLSLMELMLLILQCCFWLFEVWKHLLQLYEYWAEKKTMNVRSWMSSLSYRLYWNRSLCSDYSILSFINNNGKLFLFGITFIFGFERARRPPNITALCKHHWKHYLSPRSDQLSDFSLSIVTGTICHQ